jgi:hypothetical protein
MKNYYYNPKTQDLMIFDTESNQIDVLEVLKGIRVITSSEMRNPDGDEPVKHWKNSVWDPEDGKAHPNYDGPSRHARQKKVANPEKKGRSGKWKCKNCGELGHSAKTCKNPAKVEAAAI